MIDEYPEASAHWRWSERAVYGWLALWGPATQSEIRTRAHAPKTTVWTALSTLESRGWVESRPDPTDPNCDIYTLSEP